MTFRSLVKCALAAAILAGLGWTLSLHWDKIRHLQPPDWRWLALSLILAVAGIAFHPWVLARLMKALGQPVSYLEAVALSFIPLQAKYLPGGVWPLVFTIEFYRERGYRRSLAVSATTLFTALNVVSGLGIGASLGLKTLYPGLPRWWVAVAVVLVMVALHPSISVPILNRVLGYLKRPPLEAELRYSQLLGLALVCALAWAIYAAGFAALAHSFASIAMDDYPRLLAICALGRTLGFLAIFAPDGLGVRESIYLLGLSPLLGKGIALAVTLSARLWSAVSELVLVGVGAWYVRSHPSAVAGPGDEDPQGASEPPTDRAAEQKH